MNDGKAAAKNGRRGSSPKEPTKKNDNAEIIAELRATQNAQALMLRDLESRVQVLEIAAPAAMRALSLEEVEVIVKENRNQDLEVLEQWSFLGEVFEPGRRVKAAYYDHLLDFVRSGLKLGLPIDGGKLNTAAAEARVRADARASAH
jgi:hypothetical protein